MTVISDTTCLSALARIDKLDLLHALFGTVVIPGKVHEELQALATFGLDTSIFTRMIWLSVVEPTPSPLLDRLLEIKRLDPGEIYAIALAAELHADWIILDDLNARRIASELGLNYTGLGGILLQAKESELVSSVKEMLDLCMERANFRLSPEVYRKLLELAGEQF